MCPFHRAAEGIYHYVAGKVRFFREVFVFEIVHCRLCGCEEIVCRMIGDDAVDLLGHLFVEASETGFHVDDRDVQLRSRKGAGEGCVGIAEDDYEIRFFFEDYFLNGNEHCTRLFAVIAALYAEIVLRLGDVEIVKERTGHLQVEMLTGVYDDLRVVFLQCF